jgi:flagellin
VKGANGTETAATTSISVGTGTSFANTANGLISAINSAGLGLTASFTTQAQAGISGGGTQTGIQISGGLVSAGVDPGAASTGGILNPAGITSQKLTLGQTLTVKVGGVTAAAVTIGSATSTLTGLMNAINSNVGGSAGLVTASIVTNGNGSQSLALADTAGGGALTVTTAPNPLGPNALTNGTNSTDAVSLSFTSTNYTTGRTGTDATATLGINGTNSTGDVLTGQIVLSNNATPGASPMTFVMGSGAASGTIAGALTGGSTFTVNGNTLGNLATAIQAELGVTATVGSGGITMTSSLAGTKLELVPGAGNNTLTATPTLTVTNNEGWAAASQGTDGTATLTMNGDNGFAANGADVVSGNLVLQNGNLGNLGTPVTFAMGGVTANASSTYIVVGTGGTGSATMAQLETAITGDVALGVTGASLATGALVLTGGAVGTTITPTSTLSYAQNLAKTGPAAGNVGALSANAQVTTSGASIGATDKLAGILVLTNDGVTDTFSMGGTAGTGTIVVGTAGQNTATINQLVTAIGNAAGLGITASLNPANGTISFTSAISTNGAAPNIGVVSTTLTDNYTTTFTTPAMGSTSLGVQYEGGILSLNDGGSMNALGGTLAGTLKITNDTTLNGSGFTATFVMGQGADSQAGTTWNLSAAHSNVAGVLAAINGMGAFAGKAAGAAAALDGVASVDTASGGIFVQSATATDTSLTAVTTGLTDNVAEAATVGTGGAATANAQVLFGNAGTNRLADPVTGTITLTNSNATYGGTATFVMDGSAGHTTLGNLATLIGDANIGLTATVGAAGLLVKVSDQANQDFTSTIAVGAGSALVDAYGTLQTGTGGNPSVQAENATATVGTTGYNNSGSDTITGSITLQNTGFAGPQTFTMGMGNGQIGGTTIGALAQAISNSSLGITAIVNSTTGALEMQSNVGNTSITATSALKDTVAEGVTLGSPDPGQTSQTSTTTLNLAGGATNLQGTDVLTGAPGSTGSITITANSNTETFVMGSTAHNVNSGGLGTLNGAVFTVNGNTAADLEAAINGSTGSGGLNITASNTGSDQNLVLTSNTANGTTIGVSGDTLKDAFNNPASVASLGTFASASDVVSGTISFNLGGGTQKTFAVTPGETVTGLMNQINSGNYQYGVSASISSSGGVIQGTSVSDGFVSLTLTSNTYGTSGVIENTGGTHVTDTTPTALFDYETGAAYYTGLSSGSIASGTAIYDSSSGQSNTLAGMAGIVSNANGSSGIATISYSDGAGQALNGTDLSNQTDAQTALNSLNLAISDVASQDGYIGAQINTLNSISQVMSTQQENVVSAQNAIQATDYASATSNMSKYEILSQTGIAALAQANSVQQEVTKLLQ